MRNISKITILLLLAGFSFVSCNDMLDVDSDRLVTADQYNYTTASDSLYSMFGILSQLQKLSNSYVLLGELRADLMDVTPNSDKYLNEINNFNYSSENPYTNNIKDYYSVINNCNYVIHNIDTSFVKGGIKVLYKEYAACKSIRAWTYMQLALNYGSAIYYDQPILSVKDAEAIQKQTPKTFDEIAPLLIADLEPWKKTEVPNVGTLFSHNTRNSFFPVRFVLGDLYLWTKQYEKAATEYHDLIFAKSYTISDNNYETNLEAVNNAYTGRIIFYNGGWYGSFEPGSTQYITTIASSNQYGHYFDLDSMSINYSIAPSTIAMNNWQSQVYYTSSVLDTLIDMRYIGSISLDPKELYIYSTTKHTQYIYKYQLMNPILDKVETNKQVMVYRVALLYLRYAEAVNRIGKPNLALAVIKNGLNRANLSITKIVPSKEIPNPIPAYMDFSDVRFDKNIGVRMRGCGNVNMDTTKYIIPQLTDINDSVLYVEDLIQKELALETAFEGNRFHDLMRFAIRREDNSYLANKVAEKHPNNKEAIRQKLSERMNWYIK